MTRINNIILINVFALELITTWLVCFKLYNSICILNRPTTKSLKFCVDAVCSLTISRSLLNASPLNGSTQHENPWTVPNLLCVCRIVLSPYLGYLIIHQHFYLSLALFTMAGATDMVKHTHTQICVNAASY